MLGLEVGYIKKQSLDEIIKNVVTKKELESDPEVEDEDLKRAFSGRGHVISIYKKN